MVPVFGAGFFVPYASGITLHYITDF